MTVFGLNAKNEAQKEAIRALTGNKPFVFLTGVAGGGKTITAQAVGLERVIEQHVQRKLLYTRLQTQLGADIGALPGTLEEKTAPFMLPFLDNLDVLSSKPNELKRYLYEADEDRRRIFFESVQVMRGRSLNHSYVIFDESQNFDVPTIAALATRIGINSKLVFLGNFSQIDIPKLRTPEQNGLFKLLNGLYERNAHNFFEHVNFTETQRNPIVDVVEDILRNHAMSPEFEALEARGGVDAWKNTLTS